MQLNKYLAHGGICSRRKAVELIKQGLVTVNGKIITIPELMVTTNDKVFFNKRRVQICHSNVYIVLNKPAGYITTTSDEKGRPTVMDLLPKSLSKHKLYPVGRLDSDTTGLLLITNDGQLAHHLSHPRYEIQKVYLVTLDKSLYTEDILRLKKGIYLNDGIVTLDTITVLNIARTRLKVTIHSGKNRILRRIFEQLNYSVLTLERVSFSSITKNKLPRGCYRLLSNFEVDRLKTAFPQLDR